MLRKIDNLGRLVIPKEARTALKISEGTALSVTWDATKGKIILQIASPACIICGNSTHLTMKGDLVLCKKCLQKLCSVE